jgi:glycosyltransferase involved in cell wall biosynthesis
LFASPSLWPQPNSSAAGVRTASLLKYFASSKQGTFKRADYGCGLNETNCIIGIPPGVQIHHLPLNRKEEMMTFLHSEMNRDLKVVIFDRFFAEEAYSFYFHNERPDILRVLDMQDMHALRYHREALVKNMECSDNDDIFVCFKNSSFMNSTPSVHQTNPHTFSAKDLQASLIRELSAIHRSDLTLVCSPFEYEILTCKFSVPPAKLVHAPFFTEIVTDYYPTTEDVTEAKTPRNNYDARRDFVALGGFKHQPNVDQVFVLKHLWPKLRSRIPGAKLNVYGSFPPLRVQQLHDRKNGFLVHGYTDDLNNALGCSRVLLAPLRFGAGIKGKIVDAWRYGCPVVTTPIGAEGIGDSNDEWGGIVATDEGGFIESATMLYNDKTLWRKCQNAARHLLSNYFDADTNLSRVHDAIVDAAENLDHRRSSDYLSAMLWQNSMRSTEYMSRWIELKEIMRNKIR